MSRLGFPSRRRSRTREIGWFLGLFALYFVAGYLTLESTPGERWVLDPWTGANVHTALAVLAPFGIDASAEGRTIATDRPLVDVHRGCDGTTAALIVIAAIAAFPAPWTSRWAGILAGVAAVFAINAVRIATLSWAALHHPTWLDTLHVDVWQPLMMVSAFGLFLGWSTWVPSAAQKVAGPRANRA